MIFFLLIFILMIFNKAEFAPEHQFHNDYLSKEKANAIKGIFVVLIVFSHATQYVKLGGIYDEAYMVLKDYLSQLVVVMFLFYSGYGITEALKKRRFQYVKSIMTKRFPRVFINFAIAVMLFIIVNGMLGKTYGLSHIFLSFIGWSSVGNSNWYMFVTFVLYILVVLSFYLLKWRDKQSSLYIGGFLMILLTVIYMLGMVKAGRPPRYYDTIILFAVGMWYSLLKNQIEVLVMKNDYVYTFVFLLLMTVHFVAYRDSWEYGANGVSILEMGFWYTVWAVAFTLLVVVASMKITFCNSILSWFGKHVFSVYILQRLPMIVLSKFGLAENHKYMFLIATLIITIFIAMIFDCMTEKIWEKSK